MASEKKSAREAAAEAFLAECIGRALQQFVGRPLDLRLRAEIVAAVSAEVEQAEPWIAECLDVEGRVGGAFDVALSKKRGTTPW